MATTLHVLGIRHHGPGSARMLRAALEEIRPAAVLVEGPPDAQDMLALAANESLQPPVALLVYDENSPADSAFWPFAVFSPEWQAVRWALSNGKPLRFIDLPWASRAVPTRPSPGDADHGHGLEGETAEECLHAESEDPVADPGDPLADPLDALAQAAGFDDGEAWWGKLVEERGGAHARPLEVFAAIEEAMTAVREAAPPVRDEAARREAHMRRAIRAAVKEGLPDIAVVCGAFHVPALTAAALAATTVKSDDALLKGLPRRKTVATWVPWTYEQLSTAAGNRAGVQAPGWYDHLWRHPRDPAVPWMATVARCLRTEGLDAPPAQVIDAARLARTLASLRGRTAVGLEDLEDATLSVICTGNPMPMAVIRRKLEVGDRLGTVPDETPAVPLQKDLAAQQRSLRLKPSADEETLDLDLRRDLDLSRSHLLHRLCALGVPWGERARDAQGARGTFHETWRLRWRPELAVNVIEASRWGGTVESAATARAIDAATRATQLDVLVERLDQLLLGDLPHAVDPVIARIQAVSAVASDLAHLMTAVPPLARIARYGNVRKTSTTLVEPLLLGLLARIRAGVVAACASLDDDAAAARSAQIDGVDTAVRLVDRKDETAAWRERLRAVGDSGTHGRVAGRCWRRLYDADPDARSEAEVRLQQALSRGNDPSAAAAWVEGFLAGSGLTLVHDEGLLGSLDAWVCALAPEAFEQVCPLVRRTFATFQAPERRAIGESIRRRSATRGPRAAVPDDHDPQRAALVDPVLELVLGGAP